VASSSHFQLKRRQRNCCQRRGREGLSGLLSLAVAQQGKEPSAEMALAMVERGRSDTLPREARQHPVQRRLNMNSEFDATAPNDVVSEVGGRWLRLWLAFLTGPEALGNQHSRASRPTAGIERKALPWRLGPQLCHCSDIAPQGIAFGFLA
jgi:hypothetical protein